jgi:hypothetical protein
MVRTAIDILMATGVIKQTRRDQAIEIMWNPAQEMALLMCAANTQACVRMRAEIAEMDTAIADLRGILQRKAQRKS